MKTIAQLRREALATLGVAQRMILGETLELRATSGGDVLGKDARAALLAAAVAREPVELVMTVLAYEQGRRDSAGVVIKNRKGVRVRNGAMQALGRTGKGTPFLRDHRQGDSLARGGTVIDSRTEKLTDDGHYQVMQEVRLTEPTAVERALRDLMSAVSVGLEPLGPVNCTACGTEIFSACYHFPFDVVKLKDGTEVEVEWEYTDAGLRETSEVPIGAVHAAEIQSIRGSLTALAAQLSGALIPSRVENGGDVPHQEKHVMDPKLLALLGLAATATPEEVLAAVQAMAAGKTATAAELAIANASLAAFEGDIKSLKASERQRKEDEFILSALSTGRIGKGDEEMQRALFGADEKRAVELMAKREPNVATPVGAPRQTPVVGPAPVLGTPAPGPRIQIVREPLVGRGSLEKLTAAIAADPRTRLWASRFGYDLDQNGHAELSGATAIANAADHAAAKIGFHAAFLQSLEINAADPVSLLYATVQSNRQSEQHHFMGDLPGFEEWTDDRVLAVLKGFKLSIENKKWANGLRVKADDFKDDNLGLLPSQVGGLATQAGRHRWDLMIKLLLNGFDGTAYPEVGDGLSYDGAFFFSDSHLGGNDNKGTAALDATSLAAAGLALESMLTLDGANPMNIYGTHLIVGPKLRATAEKLMQQERLANGEDNINKGKYQLIVAPRIRGTYDDYWFLGDLSKSVKPLIFQMREEISTMETGPNGMPAFQNDELWFGAQARYGVGYFEPRLVYGSAV